jgi:hypothetical protein
MTASVKRHVWPGYLRNWRNYQDREKSAAAKSANSSATARAGVSRGLLNMKVAH